VLVVVLHPRPAPATGGNALDDREIDLTVIDSPAESVQTHAPENARVPSTSASAAESPAKARDIARGRTAAPQGSE